MATSPWLPWECVGRTVIKQATLPGWFIWLITSLPENSTSAPLGGACRQTTSFTTCWPGHLFFFAIIFLPGRVGDGELRHWEWDYGQRERAELFRCVSLPEGLIISFVIIFREAKRKWGADLEAAVTSSSVLLSSPLESLCWLLRYLHQKDCWIGTSCWNFYSYFL